MTFDNPFEASGEWLKGNLHTHTTRSDGRLSPQERVEQYEARGYDFLALTDHDVLADLEPLSANGLLLIRGIELVCSNPLGGPAYHVVGLDLPPGFQAPQPAGVQATVDAIQAAGGQAIVAHPYWCGQTIRDLEAVQGALGIEVFNSTCFRCIGKGTSSVHWDDLLAQGRGAFGFAVDDTHRETADAFLGWTVAKCAERTPEAVMDALARGRFYATCGPAIESLSFDGCLLAVRSSPVAYINFVCNRSNGGQVFREDGGEVTEAEFTLDGAETYVRVECTDAAGRTAWTNPIRLR